MRIDVDTIKAEFHDLPTYTRVAVVSMAVAELAAKGAALVDLARRPARGVRGPKWAWAAAQLINGIGPAAYWLVGRK